MQFELISIGCSGLVEPRAEKIIGETESYAQKGHSQQENGN